MNLLPEQLLSVIQAAEVLVLSQQLNRGLRAVCVQFWHVEVVDENNNAPAGRSTWQCSNYVKLLIIISMFKREEFANFVNIIVLPILAQCSQKSYTNSGIHHKAG